MATMTDLRGKHFLKLADFSPEEITYLIDLAAELKAAKKEGREEQKLVGKEIALIFEKDSTRTRCAFEVAAYDQGAHVTFIGPGGSHMGHKETVKDTARVLGRMYDAIEYRGFGQDDGRGARRSTPASRSTTGSPTSGTRRRSSPTSSPSASTCPSRSNEVVFCYLGDARFNMADSYLVGGAKLGMDVRIASPKSLWPRDEIVELAKLDRCRDGSADHDHRRRAGGRSAAPTSCSPTSGSRWESRTRSGRSGSSCSSPTR